MEIGKLEAGKLEKKGFIKDARELEVYKRAFAASLAIHKASLEFPKYEQYSLADQLRRSSKSICANLAEGYARQSYSKTEFKRFIIIAASSAKETGVWIDYSYNLSYIALEIYEKWQKEYEIILKQLYSLRNNIR